jgi:hypothetical protein
LRFAEWLNNELSTKLGIQGTIKENTSTGYKGYGIFNLQNVSNQSTENEFTPKDLGLNTDSNQNDAVCK